jgi:hypothetical protein
VFSCLLRYCRHASYRAACMLHGGHVAGVDSQCGRAPGRGWLLPAGGRLLATICTERFHRASSRPAHAPWVSACYHPTWKLVVFVLVFLFSFMYSSRITSFISLCIRRITVIFYWKIMLGLWGEKMKLWLRHRGLTHSLVTPLCEVLMQFCADPI